MKGLAGLLRRIIASRRMAVFCRHDRVVRAWACSAKYVFTSCSKGSSFRFTWWQDAKKEPTVAKILWDTENLYVGHVCTDEYITARYTRHDDPVAKDDCFEIMLTPNPRTPMSTSISNGTCEVAIPFKNFASLASVPPKPGSHWRMNLNRHGGDKNMQYSQWSSGDTTRPSFHTSGRFGRV